MDKNTPEIFNLKPTNLDGQLAFTAYQSTEQKISELIQALKVSKNRVAVAFGGSVFTVSAKGASKAMNSFVDGCSSSG